MFGLINLGLGLIKSGFEFLNKRKEIDLEKYKVDGQVDMTIVQARADVARERANDTVDRWGRRLFIYPTGIWFALIVYDSTFRMLLPTEFTWRILELPKSIEYIPYAVVGYLLIAVAKR